MFTALAVGLSLTASLWAQVPSYVPTNGLVGWWPFNGNANDESGNGNNGTVNGATLTADRFGVANKAYGFTNCQYINLGMSGNNFSTSNFTISLWFNRGPITNGAYLISKRFSESIGNWWEMTGLQNGGFVINQSNSSDLSVYGFPILPNEWHNFIVVRNGFTIKVYFNGILLGAIQTPIIHNINNNASVLVGAVLAPISGLIGCFTGQIDDIGIWNSAISECEVLDLYNAQLGSFSNSSVSLNPTLITVGSNATLTVTTPIQNLQWQSNPGNMGWNNVVNNNTYSGSNNDTLVVSNLQLSNHNQPFRVLACGDTSNIATIQIADTCITTVYDTLLTTVTDTLIINTTLSLPAPNNENTILIYPNPASDHITIDNGNFAAMAGYSIKIENNAGQQVFQSAINQAQFYVDLSTWTGNGLYFVHLIDPQNNTVTVRKIVLQ